MSFVSFSSSFIRELLFIKEEIIRYACINSLMILCKTELPDPIFSCIFEMIFINFNGANNCFSSLIFANAITPEAAKKAQKIMDRVIQAPQSKQKM